MFRFFILPLIAFFLTLFQSTVISQILPNYVKPDLMMILITYLGALSPAGYGSDSGVFLRFTLGNFFRKPPWALSLHLPEHLFLPQAAGQIFDPGGDDHAPDHPGGRIDSPPGPSVDFSSPCPGNLFQSFPARIGLDTAPGPDDLCGLLASFLPFQETGGPAAGGTISAGALEMRLKLDKNGPPEKNMALVYANVVIIVVFSVIFSRLWYLQIIKGDYFKSLSENNRIRIQEIPAPRGILFDREGIPLVDSFPSFDVSLFRQDVPDMQALVPALSRALSMDSEKLRARLDGARGTPPSSP